MKNIESQLELLKAISTCKDKYRKAILKKGDKQLISSICECVYNLLQGNLKIDDNTKKNLHKYRHILRKLVKTSTLCSKKKLLSQKGGFLPVLLPTILPAIISTIAALVANKK